MRIIAHIDMDAFFAAVEERENPRFKGRPIVVGADPKDGKGRGVVSTANYAARKYNIRSAMPIGTAWRLAEEGKRNGGPAVVFVAGNHALYSRISKEIMKILKKHSPRVEEAGIDEAYIDLSYAKNFVHARVIAQTIKKEIKNKERLTASIGIGPNKLIAKIASDKQKPDGLTAIEEKDAATFLAPLSPRVIPGVGPKTETLLVQNGIKTIGDLQNIPEQTMKKWLGKWGASLFLISRGQDDSPIKEEHEQKSIGEQETFEEDSRDAAFIAGRLESLVKNVGQRFKKSGFSSFRTIVITVRFSDFSTKARAATLSAPSSDISTIQFNALRLLLPFLDKRENPLKKEVRLVGVRIEHLF